MRSTLMKKLRSFRNDDEGVTLVEYGIGLTLAVVVGTFLLTNLGGNVKGEMQAACKILSSGVVSAGGTAASC